MKFNIITLFPELIDYYGSSGVIGRGIANNKISLQALSPRQFTKDVHKTVDDKPYGGGDGMVMLAEPLEKSLQFLSADQPAPGKKCIYLSPQGQLWSNKKAELLAESCSEITLISGRYGGIDQRIINNYVDEEISIGDFVLSGGEIPAIVLMDSMARFVPGVLGNEKSSQEESFQHQGLLEPPQFSRPEKILDQSVPDVYRSGHHKKIKDAKRNLSILVTLKKRPEIMISENIEQSELKSALLFLENMSESNRDVFGFSNDIVKVLKDKIIGN